MDRIQSYFLGVFITGILLTIMYGGIFRESIKQAKVDSYNEGYRIGLDVGDADGFQRCYDNRKSFPYGK